MEFSLKIFPFWERIYPKEGMVTMLVSRRNILLEKAIDFIETSWSFLNYIFGGIDFNKFKVEFEFIDMYIFLGIPGLVFYFYIIIFHFLKGVSFFKKTLILAVFTTSFFSGGLQQLY